MAHRILRDHEADGRERSDSPIICESCLGDNPDVRMTKGDYHKECKLCTRPLTVFRWHLGPDTRLKKTKVCHTCCNKRKNVCQVCLLELPVQVRDTVLNIRTHDSIPKSDVMREFFAKLRDQKMRGVQSYFAKNQPKDTIPKSDVIREFFAQEHDQKMTSVQNCFEKIQPNDTILKRRRTLPFHEWNKAPICRFYVRGDCIRGANCQYRHEMPPKTGESSQQNIKGSYYGVNDPAALKLLLGKVGEMRCLETPEDESIKTLDIGGLNSRVLEQDIRDQFHAYGEIESIRILAEKACAFVKYTTREGAEKAAEELSNKLVVNGQRLKLTRGRPQVPKTYPDGGSDQQGGVVAHSGLLPRAVIPQQVNQHPPMQQYYMHPQRMGEVISL